MPEIYEDESGQAFVFSHADKQFIPITEEQAGLDPVQSFATGFGSTVGGFARGAQQLVADPAEEAALAREHAQSAQARQVSGIINPISTFTGSVAPFFAAAALPGGLAAQATAGAALGGATFGTARERLTGAALGAAGGALGPAVGGMSRAVSKGITAAGKRARGTPSADAKTLRDQGFKFLEGDAAKTIGAGLESGVFSGAPLRAARQGNKALAGRQAMSILGREGDELSHANLGKAVKDIGRGFDEFGEVDVPTGQVTQGWQGILDDLRPLQADAVGPSVRSLIETIDAGSPVIKGADAQRLRTLINRDTKTLYGRGDGDSAQVLMDMKDVLDNALDAQLAPDAKAALTDLRAQWKFLKAMESGQAISKGGDEINFPSTAAALRKIYKGGFTRGGGVKGGQEGGTLDKINKFMDTARIFNKAEFKDVVGNSGTATRLGGGEALLGIGGAVSGGPVGALAGLLAAGVGGNALSRTLLAAGSGELGAAFRGLPQALPAPAQGLLTGGASAAAMQNR